MSASSTNHAGRRKAAPLILTARCVDHLRTFELRYGVSRYQLFEHAGCSYFSAALILRGEATQTPKNLVTIGNVAAIIGVAPTECVVGIELPTPNNLAVVLVIIDRIQAALTSDVVRTAIDVRRREVVEAGR